MSPRKKKGSKSEKKSLDDLRTLATPALGSPELVAIASSANSPNAAYSKAYRKTRDVASARACQYLAAIKRDHGKNAFNGVVPRVDSSNCPQMGKSKRETEMSEPVKVIEEGTEEIQEHNAVEPLIPLQSIEWTGVITGLQAEVTAKQIYKNNADDPVEAKYVFPLPDGASVIGCTMHIGDRTVVAELKEQEKARQEYHEAVSQGHHGALMEQERPNIFTMNVGGIEPGESISVEVEFVINVPWMHKGGRFTIPMVVAPRFIPGIPTGQQSGGWSPDTDKVPDASRITPKFVKEVPYHADIVISFDPGFACTLRSPSHDGIVDEQDVARDETIEVKSDSISCDRDFILEYTSKNRTPEVAVHTLQKDNEGFVMATIIPPFKAEPVASDIVFVLDISYSMNGPKIQGLKTLTKKMLQQLGAQDVKHRVGILLYDDQTQVLAPVGPITEQMIMSVDRIHVNGGTETGRALNKAHTMFPAGERQRYIILITDGQTETWKDYTGYNLGVPVIAAGIDSAVNDTGIKEIARQTNGAHELFYPGEDFDRAATTLVGASSGAVVRNITVGGECDSYGVTDVYEGRPACIPMRFKGGIPKDIEIFGSVPSGDRKVWKIHPHRKKAQSCDFLDKIWARESIRESQDRDVQTSLSLEYGIICKYTSFVAVSVKEQPGKAPIRTEVVVQLPAGWDWDLDTMNQMSALRGGMAVRRRLVKKSLGASSGARPIGAMAKSSFGFESDPDEELDCFSSGIDERYATACVLGDEPLGDPFIGEAGMECDDIEVDEMCFADAGVDDWGDDDDGTVSVGELSLEESVDGELTVSEHPGDDQDPVLDRIGLEPTASTNPFTMHADSKADRVVAIMILAPTHAMAAQEELAALNLTLDDINQMSEVERARTYYFALRLKTYGAILKAKGFQALKVEPTDPLALAWYILARKESGAKISHPEIAANIVDGVEYLNWKFGYGPRPIHEPWSLVP